MNAIRLIVLSAVLSYAPAWAGDDAAIKSALAAQQGKRVTVQMHSGSELTGTVNAVNDEVLKLAELSGKEFFDAVIRLDRIDVVIARARDK